MSTSSRSPLLIALIVMSTIAVVEGIVIVVLLTSGTTRQVEGQPDRSTSQGGPSPVVQTAPASPSSPAAANGRPTSVAFATPESGDLPRGRVGERVDSGGYVLTVLAVYDEPDPELANILDLGEGDRYIAAEVLLENRTEDGFFYGSSQFRIKDSDDFEYSGVLDYRQPGIGVGTITPGERVRGFVSFLVPDDAAGLRLIYQAPGDASYQTIHVSLEE